jgi:hypothetical protein
MVGDLLGEELVYHLRPDADIVKHPRTDHRLLGRQRLDFDGCMIGRRRQLRGFAVGRLAEFLFQGPELLLDEFYTPANRPLGNHQCLSLGRGLLTRVWRFS